jgi:hypothetical protein
MPVLALSSMFGQFTGMQVLQGSTVACIVIYLMSYRWKGRHVSCATSRLSVIATQLDKAPKLDHIPAVGFSSHLMSFVGAVEFLFNAPGVVQRGYDQVSRVARAAISHTQSFVMFDSIDTQSLNCRTSADGQ